jgi:hypothetical protein
VGKPRLIVRLSALAARAQTLLPLGVALPGVSSAPVSSIGHSSFRVARDGPFAVRGAAGRVRAPAPARAGDDAAPAVHARGGGGHSRTRPSDRQTRQFMCTLLMAHEYLPR